MSGAPAGWAVVYESDLQGEVYWKFCRTERQARRWMRLLRFCNSRALRWRVQLVPPVSAVSS